MATPETTEIARALFTRIADAAENLGLSREELDTLQKLVGKRARLAYGDNVFEIGESWGDGYVALDYFEGEGDNRLGRHQDGDARVYLFALPEFRQALAQVEMPPFLVVTVGAARSTRRFYEEQEFVNLIAAEWVAIDRALKAPFGDEDEDDTECPECGAETRVWEKDEEGDLTQVDAAKHCGSCGVQIPIKAEVVS